jgi:hypothetical protein
MWKSSYNLNRADIRNYFKTRGSLDSLSGQGSFATDLLALSLNSWILIGDRVGDITISGKSAIGAVTPPSWAKVDDDDDDEGGTIEVTFVEIDGRWFVQLDPAWVRGGRPTMTKITVDDDE